MTHLTKQLAVGRLPKEGGKALLICSHLIKKDDDLKETYAEKLDAILEKGSKFPNKRIRLTSEDNLYEIQVQPYEIEENTKLLFIVVTAKNFGQSFDLPTLLDEFKDEFLDLHNERDILKARKNGSVNKKSQNMLAGLGRKYGKSKLSAVQSQVEDIKSTLNDGITMALDNVEAIETVEANAASLEKEALKFKKEAKVVKVVQQKKYYKTQMYLAILVIVIIIIIIIAICSSPIEC